MSQQSIPPTQQEENSRYFVLQVHFLLERYHGYEWPPSPRRLFLAFVSALYQGSKQRVGVDEGERALEYMESMPPPAIQAAGHEGSKYTLFVPNNDQDLLSAAYEKGKIPSIDLRKLTTGKVMKPYITEDIQYLWKIEDYKKNKVNIDTLCKLANQIPVLGLGIDAVTIHGKITEQATPVDKAHCYISDENSDHMRIDVPLPGLLEDAKRHYNEFIHRITKERFVQPRPITRYRSQRYRKDTPDTEFIVFKITDRVNGRQFISNDIVPKLIQRLDKLRQEVFQDKNNHDGIKTIVLPSIGGQHSDSAIRRIAFILPPNTSQGTKQSLASGLHSKTIEIDEQQYQLEAINGNSDNVRKNYDKRSRSWRSVTQLDLKIERNSTRQEITKSILGALKKEGIEDTITFVNFRKEPYWNNLPKLSEKTSVYADIEFKSDIKGPFAIGENQNIGHGLFAPNTMPDVAYFTVLGVRPPIEETVRVADLMRSSAMSKLKGMFGSQGIPSNISGHNTHGDSLKTNHQHAFWLPVDTDHDGLIDHIAVYVPNGFDSTIREAFYKIRELQNGYDLRLNVSFRGFHDRISMSEKCQLFKKEKEWVSVTPYFMPWHIKKGFEREDQLKKEFKKRWHYNDIIRVEDHVIHINDRSVPATSFQSTHNNKKLINAAGEAVKVSFKKDVRGPIMLGSHSHFGLGMFVPCNKSHES